jgi:hypothetical protein
MRTSYSDCSQLFKTLRYDHESVRRCHSVGLLLKTFKPHFKEVGGRQKI